MFGAIEILPPAAAADIGQIVGGCSTDLAARSPFRQLGDFAGRMLMPEPLHAAVVVKTGGVGGLASRFSKFGAVDPELDLIAQPASTSGLASAPVAVPPSVLVRTKSLLNPIPGITIRFAATPGSITPAQAVTGANGIAASTSWTLGNGTNTATATAVAPVSEMHFTPPFVTFTAQGAPGAPAFGSANWSYLIQSGLPADNSWTTLSWPVTQTGWAQATAPFGSVGINQPSPSNCADQAPTSWPVNSVILLRRDVFIPSGTTSIAISVKIDNDVRVFLNGTERHRRTQVPRGLRRDQPAGPVHGEREPQRPADSRRRQSAGGVGPRTGGRKASWMPG